MKLLKVSTGNRCWGAIQPLNFTGVKLEIKIKSLIGGGKVVYQGG